jgi:hypothetical protein
MKIIISLCLVCALCLIAGFAAAQPFALVDASHNAFGAGAGTSLGSGKLQPGFLADVFHGYTLERIRPDTEAYGSLGWTMPGGWYSAIFLGGGATLKGEDADALWSARSFLVLTQTTPVAFRTSSFVMWTPSESGWFVEQKVGPSIKLNDTGHRLFPYLAVDVTTPGAIHRMDVSLHPGCTLIMNF